MEEMGEMEEMEKTDETIKENDAQQPNAENESPVTAALRRLEEVKNFKKIAISVTNDKDWVDQNGRPYLTGSGAEKIARVFGVNWKDMNSEKRVSCDEGGEYYMYAYTATFTLGKDSIEAIGTCSCKDAFFARYKGHQRPMHEIDETNIMKAAYTNCIVNGITRILGIRAMTWEEVEESGHIRQETAVKVNYKENTQIAGYAKEPRDFSTKRREYANIREAFKSVALPSDNSIIDGYVPPRTDASVKPLESVTGHAINIGVKEGSKKDGTIYKCQTFNLIEDGSRKNHLVKTFDDTALQQGMHIKITQLKLEEYRGTKYLKAQKIETLGEPLDIPF